MPHGGEVDDVFKVVSAGELGLGVYSGNVQLSREVTQSLHGTICSL